MTLTPADCARNLAHVTAIQAILERGATPESTHLMRATSQEKTIKYPLCDSEFEVQAWLFSELRSKGYDVRGEVNFLGSFGLRETKATCRFDLVVFKAREAALVLEVKARPVSHKRGVANTRQGIRYTQFGVPVLFVYGIAGAKDAVSFVEETVKK